MKHSTSRSKELKNKLNTHLSKLTGVNKDFYSKLTKDDVIGLKTVLADIHNVLTLRTTNASAKWICKYFKMSLADQKTILSKIDKISPNSSGFDIIIHEPYKIIGEVKCIAPVKNGDKFGAAQKNAILDDFGKLLNGKKALKNTKDYYKFLFLIDLGARSYIALEKLLIEAKLRVKTEIRLERNVFKTKVKILINESADQLSKEIIYAKVIKLT